MKKILTWSILAMALYACDSPTLNKKDYLAYISNPENGLVQNQSVEEILFSLRYIPFDYLKLLGNAGSGSTRNYFQLEMSFKGQDLMSVVQADEYYQLLNYFETQLQKDIYLINKKDTLSCLISHLQRDYGLGNKTIVVLEFEESPMKSDKEVLFDFPFDSDPEPLVFKYSKKHLRKIPKLQQND